MDLPAYPIAPSQAIFPRLHRIVKFPCKSLSTALLGLALFASCGGEGEPQGDARANDEAVAMPDRHWSDAPLEGAIDVKDARANHSDGDQVVLRGTLQDFGSLATFLLVEDSLKDCSEKDDDACATPWDYCCEDPEKLQQWTVNVEFMDGDLPADWSLDGVHGLTHLSEVAVAGTLRFDEAGNMRLEADRLSMQ